MMFSYYATDVALAMTKSTPGTGSAYANTVRDSNRSYLDGSRTYKATLPRPIQAKNFSSFTVYDNQTRSVLPTEQKRAGLYSMVPDNRMNQDGGVTIWFGPKAPADYEKNWVQIMAGKGYNVALRLCGKLEPRFNKTCRPGDLELQP